MTIGRDSGKHEWAIEYEQDARSDCTMIGSARLWALATPGILTRSNGHDLALLGGMDPSARAEGGSAEVLERDWNTRDRADVLRILDYAAYRLADQFEWPMRIRP